MCVCECVGADVWRVRSLGVWRYEDTTIVSVLPPHGFFPRKHACLAPSRTRTVPEIVHGTPVKATSEAKAVHYFSS